MEFNSGDNEGARSGGNDVELLSKTLQVEHQLFYFDLKENPCGGYLKILEKTSLTRSTISVPFNGISWFFDILNYYVTSDDQDISSKELQLDSKAIYYITHYTYYTYTFIFITLQNGSFFRCFTLTMGKTGGVGFLRNHLCVLVLQLNIPKENAIMFVHIANLHQGWDPVSFREWGRMWFQIHLHDQDHFLMSPFPYPGLHQIIIIGCNKQLDLKKVLVAVVPVEAHTPTIEDELEMKLKESHISDDKHVIIPNHLHVPEAEKLGFCFGSFDATFGFNKTPSNLNGLVAVTVSEMTSEASEEADETIEDQMQSRQHFLINEDHLERPTTSSSNVPKNLPTEGDVSLNAGPEYRESKQETSSSSYSSSFPTPSHQYPAVHTSPNPNFSFGFMPPIIEAKLHLLETPSLRHAMLLMSQSLFSNYLIQHAIMHTFIVRNSLILSTTGPTPTTATQTVRVMQSSISVTQQPLPIFQQPSGVHLPHYPPNYIPYGPYFSLFYVPPPAAIHQFLSNRTFPQQPQQGAGGMYPAPPPPVAATSNSKYPLPQYMPRSNTWNIGMTGSYGPYASAAPAGYNFASVAANSMESFRP
uniref:Uncharacterized protein n=1 Tax=Lactuca sativa TaxID=4236 RepID=A0A9R1V7U7_LACSA|nr:hypothetical protein LSAT_V11C600318160 [Lactuca sativa]